MATAFGIVALAVAAAAFAFRRFNLPSDGCKHRTADIYLLVVVGDIAHRPRRNLQINLGGHLNHLEIHASVLAVEDRLFDFCGGIVGGGVNERYLCVYSLIALLLVARRVGKTEDFSFGDENVIQSRGSEKFRVLLVLVDIGFDAASEAHINVAGEELARTGRIEVLAGGLCDGGGDIDADLSLRLFFE